MLALILCLAVPTFTQFTEQHVQGMQVQELQNLQAEFTSFEVRWGVFHVLSCVAKKVQTLEACIVFLDSGSTRMQRGGMQPAARSFGLTTRMTVFWCS